MVPNISIQLHGHLTILEVKCIYVSMNQSKLKGLHMFINWFWDMENKYIGDLQMSCIFKMYNVDSTYNEHLSVKILDVK